jgi:iron complex outermembrane recepter protein
MGATERPHNGGVSMTGILGRNFVVSVLFLVAAGFWCSGAQAQAQTLVHFDLPAQPLARSLKAIGTATNTDVGFDSSQVAGFTAPAVKADLTLDDALIRVLTGTRLRPKHLDDHTVVITVTASTTSNSMESKELLARASITAEAEGQIPTPQGPAPSESTDEASSPGSNKKDLEEIVVTGTHISGAAPVGAPLITVTATDIANSGYSTVGDVIRSIPQAFGGGNNPGVLGAAGATNSQNVSSSSTVNLRGLGSDSTLTLVDGHRLSFDGFTSSFDISSIPLAAIDRIEILTDSASAIYGSDAVAGVANFILKKNYEGAQTTATFGEANGGAATEYDVGQLLGTNWSGGNAMLSYEHYRQDALYASQRSFSDAAADPLTLLPRQSRDSVFGSVRQSFTEAISA